MALRTYLVEREERVGNGFIDEIAAVVIVIDDSNEDTNAKIRNAAVDRINTLTSGSETTKLPQDYFTTQRLIANTPVTLDADNDLVVFSGRRVLESIA